MKLHYLLVLMILVGCGPVAIVAEQPDETPILIRSPQPDAEDLEDYQHLYGIKTVVNLRGEQAEDWYLEESLACNDLKLELISIRASGRYPPTQEEMDYFLDIVNDPAKQPVLIHCQGGIHRTGVYVAIYRLLVQKRKPASVLRELESNYFDWTLQDRSAIKEWLRSYPQAESQVSPHQ